MLSAAVLLGALRPKIANGSNPYEAGPLSLLTPAKGLSSKYLRVITWAYFDTRNIKETKILVVINP